VNQNFGDSDENVCEKCFKMKDHLEMLVNELKSAQLIIKTLQEEIKKTSIGTGNRDNLTNCAEYKSHEEYHTTSEKNSAWKEIRHANVAAMKHKKYNHKEQGGCRHIPIIIESL
jgi:hypothetical protein